MPKYTEWTTPEGVEKVGKWAAAGLTDAEIADGIGVSRKTLYAWAKKYPAFGEALQAGKERSNDAVEGALYRKCVGYTVPVKKTFKVRRVDYDQETGRKLSEHEELVEGVDEQYIAPDTNAQKFWLTNRMPERWKNKVELGAEDRDLVITFGGDGAAGE